MIDVGSFSRMMIFESANRCSEADLHASVLVLVIPIRGPVRLTMDTQEARSLQL